MKIDIGTTLKKRYRVEESLGRGGMAEVYKVWDEQRSVEIAMKVLRQDIAQDPIFLRRFQREAKALASLQHPNIVRFYGLERERELAFLLMEYIDGESLQVEILLAEGRPLSGGRIREVLQPVCRALHYAHQNRLVHCDIKPGNILIEKSGRVLLTDFGIARLTDAATATMLGAGTPAYMAPELIQGKDPSPQTDIYALGIVLYEMLTGGERPFIGEAAQITGTTAEKVRWEQLHLPPAPPSRHNPTISPAWEAVVLRCLEKQPAKRYSSCLELMQALGSKPGAEEYQSQAAQPIAREPERVQPAGLKGLQPQKEPIPHSSSNQSKEKKVVKIIVIGLLAALISITFFIQFLGGGMVHAKKPAADYPAAEVIDSQISPADGMVMVYVPAGKFLMGSSEDDPLAGEDEKPQHEVSLDAFWIDQTEVSNAQYAQCVAAGACEKPANSGSIGRDSYYGNSAYADNPVMGVDWGQAKAYCSWAGRRLPGEAEWEKAARGTDGRVYPWGDATPNSDLLNYNRNEGNTTKVGSYPAGASPYGALDMAGNVWEWTADWYDANYYGYSPSETPPDLSVSVSTVVLRGGSWSYDERYVRAASRIGSDPFYWLSNNGFRCAMDAE